MACSVCEHLNLREMDSEPKLCFNNRSWIWLAPRCTLQNAATYIFFAFSTSCGRFPSCHVLHTRCMSCTPRGAFFFLLWTPITNQQLSHAFKFSFRTCSILWSIEEEVLCQKSWSSSFFSCLRFWHHSSFVKCYKADSILMLLSGA